jgi:hypothetical protein
MVSQTLSHSSGQSGATASGSTSQINYVYNDLGQLIDAQGYSTSNSSTGVWSDLNADGRWDVGESFSTPGWAQTKNTYRIIWGQAVVSQTKSISGSQTADSLMGSATQMDYVYDSRGVLMSVSTPTVYSQGKELVWGKDKNGDGKWITWIARWPQERIDAINERINKDFQQSNEQKKAE